MLLFRELSFFHRQKAVHFGGGHDGVWHIFFHPRPRRDSQIRTQFRMSRLHFVLHFNGHSLVDSVFGKISYSRMLTSGGQRNIRRKLSP